MKKIKHVEVNCECGKRNLIEGNNKIILKRVFTSVRKNHQKHKVRIRIDK